MPAEDEVKVATVMDSNGLADGDQLALPVEFSVGISQVAELLAVHWNISAFGHSSVTYYSACLSSNPEHLLTAPTSIGMFQSEATYGLYHWDSRVVVAGTDNAYVYKTETAVIPLYGILVPKRQVVCWESEMVSTVIFKAEIYYRVKTISRQLVDAINIKQGKFRRT
jgi:hypothetical protein